jgi:hypothetical protein
MRKMKREYIEKEMPQLSNVKLINSQNLRPKKKNSQNCNRLLG